MKKYSPEIFVQVMNASENMGIPREYLLDGFDATTSSSYYKKMTDKNK